MDIDSSVNMFCQVLLPMESGVPRTGGEMLARMCNINIAFLVTGQLLLLGQLQAVEQSGEKRLIADLMSTYDKRVRPIVNVSDAITVSLNFYVLSISEFEERKQELKVFGVLEVLWQDEYLTWNPANYNGTDAITVPPGQLWVPDIVLTNSATKMYDDSYYNRFHMVVRNTSHVRWVPAGHMSTSCKLNLEAYPFDVQTCQFEFDNWSYDGRKVALVNGSSEINLFLYSPHGEWDITGNSLEGHTLVAPNGVLFKRVMAVVQLTRKYTFYLVIIVAPSMLMSLLSIFVFCLPPDAGEKISLGVTVLLSFSVFSLLVADNLPKSSDHVPVLVTYLTAAMVMAAASLVMSVFILRVHHHGPRSRVPRWLRFVAFRCLGKIVFFPGPEDDNKTGPEPNIDTTHIEDYDPNVIESEKVNGEKARPEGEVLSAVKQILNHIMKMTQHLKQSEQDDVIWEEWKGVAAVMDRFFCGLYVLGIIIMSVLVLYAKKG